MPRLINRQPRGFDVRREAALRQHVAALAWSPDGRTPAIGGADGSVTVVAAR